MIVIKEVTNKRDLKKFVKFQIKLYKNDPYFVPQLILDEMATLSPKTNSAYKHCTAKFWLAYDGNKIVGRIGAIINRIWNETQDVKQLRFTRFDTINDLKVSKALFDTVKEYAKENGLDEIIGPIGFSDLDKQGMEVAGFDKMGMVLAVHNYPYYPEHMDKLGFKKRVDWVEYRLTLPEKIDERIERISQRTLERGGYQLKHFSSIKEIEPFFREGLHIMNIAYAHLYGYVAVSEEQITEFWKQFKAIINPDLLIAIIDKNEKAVAYGLMAPSLSNALNKCRGKLLPTGLLRIIKSLKKFDTVDFYSVGVLPELQNTGLNAVILNEGIKACIKHGVKWAETGPELETNEQVQAQWKGFIHEQHKRRRCYYLKVE